MIPSSELSRIGPWNATPLDFRVATASSIFPVTVKPTEIAPLKQFYKAEDYHQNYFNQNANANPYCSVVIRPKLQKLLKKGLIKE